MIAGWLWKDTDTDNLTNIKVFMIKSIKRLYLTCTLASIISVFCNNLFIKINFLTINPSFLETAAGQRYGLAKYYMMSDIVNGMEKSLLAVPPLVGALWFVQTLFIAKLVYGFIEYFCKKMKSRNMWTNIIMFLIFAISMYMALNNIECNTKWNVSRIGVSIFTIHLGRIIRKYSDMITSNSNPIMLIFMGLGFTYISTGTKLGSILYSRTDFINPLYFILCSIAGWFLVYGISELINSENNIIKHGLIFIGTHTMPIVIFHILSFKIVTFVQIKLYQEPDYMLGTISYLHNEGWWWAIYTIIQYFLRIIFSLHRVNVSLLKHLADIRLVSLTIPLFS